MTTGHLRKRGNSWLITIELDKNASGERQRIYETVKLPQKQAKALMMRMIAEIDMGIYVEPSKLTIEEYLDSWLDSKKPNIAVRTYESYRMIITKHLSPEMGKIKLDKLQPITIETYKNTKQKTLSNRTIQYHLKLLRQALDGAIKLRIIKYNPCDAIEMPRVKKRSVRPLTIDEINQLLEAAKEHREYPIIYCALHTGMRLGEVLGLQWDNVDTKNNILRVRNQLQRTETEGLVLRAVLKSNSGYRDITVSKEVIKVLKAHHIVGAKYTFSLKDGRPFDPKNTSDAFKDIAKEAGIKNVRFHDMRHTHISQLLAAGVPLIKVQKRAGHERPSTTLDIYGHLIPNEDDGIGDIYELYLKSQTAGRQLGDKKMDNNPQNQ